MIGCLTEHINSAAYSCQEQLHNSCEASLYQSKSIASASFKVYLFSKRQFLTSTTHNWYININKMDICIFRTTKISTVRSTEVLKNNVQGDIFQMPNEN